jgi:hypothetical protein
VIIERGDNRAIPQMPSSSASIIMRRTSEKTKKSAQKALEQSMMKKN